MTEQVIKFNIQHTKAYCGGAAPSEEMLLEYRTPRPYSGSVYVHGSSLREDQGTEIKLVDGQALQAGFSKGEYFIFRNPKLDLSQEIQLKKGQTIECLKIENNKILAQFSIDSKTTEISDTIHLGCNPCEEPMP